MHWSSAIVLITAPAAIELALALMPLAAPASGFSSQQLPFLVHLLFRFIGASLFLFPYAVLVAGVFPDRRTFVLGMTAAVGSVIAAGLPIPLIVLAADAWTRPWDVLAIFFSSQTFLVVGMPVAIFVTLQLRKSVVEKARAHEMSGEVVEDATSFDETLRDGSSSPGPSSSPDVFAFLWATVIGTVATTLFFSLGFVFLTLFHAARRSTVLQLLAIVTYSLTANIFFKKTIVPFAVKKLSAERKADVVPALLAFFECIGELFMAFSFPAVKNVGLLIGAVVLEVFLFLVGIRRMHPEYAAFEDAVTRKCSRAATVSPQNAGATPALTQASHKGSVVAFGTLYFYEVAASLGFLAFFPALCFGPNAAYLSFGDNADATCTLAQFWPPIVGTIAAIVLHTAIFLLVRSYLRRKWSLDPLLLSLEWMAKFRVFAATVLWTSMTLVMTFIFAHYNVQATMRSVVE